MIGIEVRADNVGVGLLPDGNVGITGLDHGANIAVTIVFSSEAWKRFLEQAPRLKGVGIPIVGAGAVDLSGNSG